KDKINFYYFAKGSATETQSHLIYCKEVKYTTPEAVDQLIKELEEICKSLNKIIKTLHNQ
ncbi:MAG: four helix bundle protein, partial [Candidatus Tenebribacter mawsonii]|nr:four helix bundle protein [Candidatus Tenebribacter mawsonii]